MLKTAVKCIKCMLMDKFFIKVNELLSKAPLMCKLFLYIEIFFSIFALHTNSKSYISWQQLSRSSAW